MTSDSSQSANIEHTSGNFAGVRGNQIFFQEWAPKNAPARGVILIVHGYAEHSGRYSALATDLVEAGFAVGALDHRGHGQSEGKRVQVQEFDDLVDDLSTYEGLLRGRYPAPLPLFILGHSMGGLISLRYVTRDDSEATGLVLSGAAADKPDDISSLTITIGNLLAKVAPDFGVASLQLDKISRDPAVVEAYENDPLVTDGKVRARMGSEMINAMDVTGKAVPTLTVPILIMHGGDDVVTPPHGSKMISEKVGSQDKTLTIYDGLYHEIYNEPERDVVIADVVAWLNERVPQE